VITIQYDRKQLGAAAASLERLAKVLWDREPTMDAIGAYMVSSKPSYRARTEGGVTLSDRGHLKASLAHLAGRDTVEVGTNMIYAGIHQMGGVIEAKNALALRFKVGKQWLFRFSVTMPARPFLGIDQRDEQEIDAIVQADLQAAVDGKA
jgi:phage gpG-like protein